MPTFRFNKLVRDKIVEHQIAAGAQPHYHQLDDEHHKAELINKIVEEAREILQADQADIASEIADVQQAVDDLKAKFSLSDAAIAKAQQAKNNKNGSFKKGIFVDYVEVAEGDKWVVYYRKNSDRYPEID
jgi:predicted house-cleaning noncanonical NTP pyrophosphatase (MazG superfamily)